MDSPGLPNHGAMLSCYAGLMESHQEVVLWHSGDQVIYCAYQIGEQVEPQARVGLFHGVRQRRLYIQTDGTAPMILAIHVCPEGSHIKGSQHGIFLWRGWPGLIHDQH